jgi:hypothetical protein
VSDTPRDARWSEVEPDLPSELSELLRAGRETLGGAEEVAELARRLSAVLGPAAGLTGDGQPAAPDSGASPRANDDAARGLRSPSEQASGGAPALGAAGRTWALGGIGAAVTIGVAAFVLLRGPSAPVDSAQQPGTLAPSGLAEAAPVAPAEPASAAPPAPSSAAPAARDGDVERGTGAGADRSTPPRPAAARAPTRAAPARQARAGGASETALLEQARAALESRPAEALALTQRHQSRFPHGALAQEREVIAIEALERLGRKAAAKARAGEFERRYRGSVHQPRLLRGSDTSVPAGGALNTTVP